jgi:hypothetical protein
LTCFAILVLLIIVLIPLVVSFRFMHNLILRDGLGPLFRFLLLPLAVCLMVRC